MLMVSLFLFGCSQDTCYQLHELIDTPSKRSALLEWADGSVFGRRFERHEIQWRPRYLGPGRHGRMVDLDRAGIRLPDFLSGYFLWLVGPSPLRPDVILVGSGNHKGVIVTRGEYHQSMGMLADVEIFPTEHEFDRLGVICVNRD